jgi:hypothetical protein
MPRSRVKKKKAVPYPFSADEQTQNELDELQSEGLNISEEIRQAIHERIAKRKQAKLLADNDGLTPNEAFVRIAPANEYEAQIERLHKCFSDKNITHQLTKDDIDQIKDMLRAQDIVLFFENWEQNYLLMKSELIQPNWQYVPAYGHYKQIKTYRFLDEAKELEWQRYQRQQSLKKYTNNNNNNNNNNNDNNNNKLNLEQQEELS